MRVLAVLCLLVAFSLPAYAQNVDDVLGNFSDAPAAEDGGSVEDVLSGFGDDGLGADTTPTADTPRTPSPLDIHGDIRFSASYSYAHDEPEPGQTDHRGLSRLRAELRLNANYTFSPWAEVYVSGRAMHDAAFALNDRDEYTDEHLDSMEDEAELFEAWARTRLGSHAELKAGRQIVTWGTSDNLRITDVINPLDSREPGMVDIEDLRLPVAMTRLSFFRGNTTVAIMTIHEERYDKRPPYGSDYYPAPVDSPDEHDGFEYQDNTEYAASLSAYLRGFDLSLYAASIEQNTAQIGVVPGTPPTVFLLHDRVRMAGAAFAASHGNVLVKLEAAYFSDVDYIGATGTAERAEAMIGIEYSGFTNTTIAVETAERRIIDYDSVFAAPNESVEESRRETALRITRTFFREQLDASLVAMATGAGLDDGGFVRANADIEMGPGITLSVGAIDYIGGTGYFEEIKDNDRIFTTLEYAF